MNPSTASPTTEWLWANRTIVNYGAKAVRHLTAGDDSEAESLCDQAEEYEDLIEHLDKVTRPTLQQINEIAYYAAKQFVDAFEGPESETSDIELYGLAGLLYVFIDRAKDLYKDVIVAEIDRAKASAEAK